MYILEMCILGQSDIQNSMESIQIFFKYSAPIDVGDL